MLEPRFWKGTLLSFLQTHTHIIRAQLTRERPIQEVHDGRGTEQKSPHGARRQLQEALRALRESLLAADAAPGTVPGRPVVQLIHGTGGVGKTQGVWLEGVMGRGGRGG